MKQRASVAQGLIALAAIVVIAAGVRAASSVAVPILLALFVAFISAPLVFRLSRRGVPNSVAVVLVLLLQLAALLGVGTLIGSSIDDFRARVPTYSERLGDLTASGTTWLEAHGIETEASHDQDGVPLDPGQVMDLFGSALSSLGGVLSSGILVLLIAAFTLFDAGRIWRQIDRHFAAYEGESLLNEISHEVNRYLAVKTATSAVTGVLSGLACWTLDVDFPVLWGLLAFLLNYIPTIGSVIAAVPPVLIALVMAGPGAAAILLALYLAINGVVGNVIEPRVMGQALGLSPVVVLISVVVFGYVLGPVGALLSVPLTMILKIALSSRPSSAWVAQLMGGDDPEGAAPPPEPTGRLSMMPTLGGPEIDPEQLAEAIREADEARATQVYVPPSLRRDEEDE